MGRGRGRGAGEWEGGEEVGERGGGGEGRWGRGEVGERGGGGEGRGRALPLCSIASGRTQTAGSRCQQIYHSAENTRDQGKCTSIIN